MIALTEDERCSARATFARDGVVRLPARIEPAAVAAMRAAMWTMIEAHGVARADRRTWTAGGALRLIDIAGALRPGPGLDGLWAVGRTAACAPLGAALGAAVDEVFGPGVWAPIDDQLGGLAMPNFPLAVGPWTVPHAAWHVDEPTTAGQADPWGLLGFACLDAVEPGGGATVAVAGSHRRLARLADALAPPSTPYVLTTDVALAALAPAEPWFDELMAPGDPAARRARYLDEAYLSDGIPLRVVELTGAAGDLVLMDPRCLHTVSANTSARARLVMRLVCARQG